VLTYRPTNADRAELPVSYLREPRYLGYREIEGTRPFAKYFAGTTRPVQAHVRHALLAGMAPPEYGYDVDDAVRRLAGPGYHNMETGFTRLDSGVIVVSCLTDMPGVTAAMWDWWFGWHIVETRGPIKPGTTKSLDEVKDSIQATLLQTKKNAAIQAWVAALPKKYADQISYAPGYAPAAASTDTGTTTATG